MRNLGNKLSAKAMKLLLRVPWRRLPWLVAGLALAALVGVLCG